MADDDGGGVDLLVLLALSVVVPSLKLLFTFLVDEILLLLLADAVVDDDFAFPSPPELEFDSLSSTENGNTIATHFLNRFCDRVRMRGGDATFKFRLT